MDMHEKERGQWCIKAQIMVVSSVLQGFLTTTMATHRTWSSLLEIFYRFLYTPHSSRRLQVSGRARGISEMATTSAFLASRESPRDFSNPPKKILLLLSRLLWSYIRHSYSALNFHKKSPVCASVALRFKIKQSIQEIRKQSNLCTHCWLPLSVMHK